MTGPQRTSADFARATPDAPRPTAWVGWILFAGVMLILLGVFQAIAGLVAIFNRGYFHTTPTHLAVHLNYTAYGWVHLALAVLSILAGYGVMAAKTWARIYAIVLASLSAIYNLTEIAAYPVWSIIVIALDVLVIYAIAVHGHEVEHGPAQPYVD